MEFVVYPRYAPHDRIRVWLGAFGVVNAPALTWRIDGQVVEPAVISSLASVRPPDQHDPGEARAFSGIYEFTGLTPDHPYRIEVSGPSASASTLVNTLPEELPGLGQGWFNVLLVSCYHHTEAPRGVLESVISRIRRELPPHLTLLLGDQVYLDLPTLANFPNDRKWLARKFEKDYITNWGGPSGMAAVLGAAPSVGMPDDHEFWNNYPHRSPIIGNSLTESGRNNWRAAAEATYQGFQMHRPGRLGDAVQIDIGKLLSIYVADTRSQRHTTDGKNYMLTSEQFTHFDAWCKQVREDKRSGVFVTGQSMFAEPAGAWQGTVADKELSNYADCQRIVESLVDIKRDLMCVTGDVHWGRFVESHSPTSGRYIYEMITSPSALVTTVGSDQRARVGNWLRGWFGRAHTWPRHHDTPDAPAHWHHQWLGSEFQSRNLRAIKGDQVAVLSFRRAGSRLEAKATWYPIHASANAPVRYGPFPLPRNLQAQEN